MGFLLKVLSRSDVSDNTVLKRKVWLESRGVTDTNYKTLLKDHELMIGNNKTPVNTRLTRCFHILGFIRELIDEEQVHGLEAMYEKIVDRLKVQQMGIKMFNIKDPNFISLEDLQEKLSKHTPSTDIRTRAEYKELESYILVSLYTNTPAVRNDFYQLVIINKANDADYKRNFIAINPRNVKLVLNDYKTNDTFGRAILDVDKHTATMIRKLIKARKIVNLESPYLFAHIAKDGSMEPNTNPVTMLMRLKKASDKYFGFPYSVNVFRHAWETYIQATPEYQKMTLHERAKEHAKLLHGLQIALEYNRV